MRCVDVPTSGNAGGSFYGRNAPGTARFVVDEARGLLVGATITGSEAAEFIHAATIAVVGEVPLTRLRHAVPAFPTRSEIWLRLFEELALWSPPTAQGLEPERTVTRDASASWAPSGRAAKRSQGGALRSSADRHPAVIHAARRRGDRTFRA